MKQGWLHRTLSTASIIFIVVVGILLLSQLQSLGSQTDTPIKSGIYILISVLILAGILLYVLALQRPVVEKIIEKVIEKETENKTKEEEIEHKEEEINQDEIDQIINSILPDEKEFSTYETYTEKTLSNLAKEFEIVQGVAFLKEKKEKIYKAYGKFAYFMDEPPKDFKEGESIPGQVAKNKKLIVLDDIPEGYIKIISGLGDAQPRHLILAPIVKDDSCNGVLELASFKPISKKLETTLSKLADRLANKIVELNKA